MSVVDACYQLIPILENRGFNVVVETVLWPGVLNTFLELLRDIPSAYLIGVHCPLDELKKREIVRENRKIGNAERQFRRLHVGMIYDVEVDTHTMTYEQCCSRVVRHCANHEPRVIDELRRRRMAR